MPRIAVVGATGYVGTRLISSLLCNGHQVRAIGRSLSKLKERIWSNNSLVELVQADALRADSLGAALNDIEIVYYLIHSMNAGQTHFDQADRIAAKNVADAAAAAGVQRIIYLAGLGEECEELSKHLRSRREVEQILKSGKVPVTILRAAMIIGAGSASFEILRYLVDRLPVMITPRWVSTESEPIAISNVVTYLTECVKKRETVGSTFEIGGGEILTYHDLMRIYAEEAKLPKRFIIPVPVLTPRLSSYWIHLVTPIDSSVAKPLAEGLRNRVVTRENQVKNLIPQKLLSAREAIRLALNQNQHFLTGDESSAEQNILEWVTSGDPKWAGGLVFQDNREQILNCDPAGLWQLLKKIGGDTGWYFADWLWIFRGFLDKLFGGVGMRKVTSNLDKIVPGDVIDFWRVEKVEDNRRLLLRAEMKLPGDAILEFIIKPISSAQIQFRQNARFIPRGLGGIIYWFLVLPFHHFIFGGMIREISKKAEAEYR